MSVFNRVQGLLEGKKTYLVALVAVVLNFCVYMNWLTVDQLTQVNVVLGFLGLSALRAGVEKV